MRKLTILYATETGNAWALAEKAAALAAELGLAARLADMATYNTSMFEREQDLLVIASTHGEGDPPNTVMEFFEYLDEAEIDLSDVRFTVLALGDSGYDMFCEAGRWLDRRLKELGGTRLGPRQDVDVDGLKSARESLSAGLVVTPTTLLFFTRSAKAARERFTTVSCDCPGCPTHACWSQSYTRSSPKITPT